VRPDGEDMKTGLPKVLEQLQQAGGGLTDGQLLARFVAARDEASFAALLRRHGPMVLGVCRRVLRDFHDAEDAFQATFLILARKAPSVAKGESVACWLYAVANNAAREAVNANARRRARERQVKDMPHAEVAPAESTDWRPLLDRELNRLSEKYRATVILCDLEGLPHKEAARLLGVAPGTVSSRLARAHALLAKRLTARGVALSGGALAVALAADASAQVPAALVNSTARVAALVAAGQLAAGTTPAVLLMKGVMKAMLVKKLRLAVGAFMVAAVIGAVGFACRPGGQAQAQTDSRVKQADPAPPAAAKLPGDVEALRREVEDLRATVRVLLKENRALEKELEEIRSRSGPGARPGSDRFPAPDPKQPPKNADRPGVPAPEKVPDNVAPPPQPRGTEPGSVSRGVVRDPKSAPASRDYDKRDVADQPREARESRREALATAGQQVEAALKALREARDQESEQRAAQLLERATRHLQEQLVPADTAPAKR
jgi:RNA polymerase sigma factor (sigma-70 family)